MVLYWMLINLFLFILYNVKMPVSIGKYSFLKPGTIWKMMKEKWTKNDKTFKAEVLLWVSTSITSWHTESLEREREREEHNLQETKLGLLLLSLSHHAFIHIFVEATKRNSKKPITKTLAPLQICCSVAN